MIHDVLKCITLDSPLITLITLITLGTSILIGNGTSPTPIPPSVSPTPHPTPVPPGPPSDACLAAVVPLQRLRRFFETARDGAATINLVKQAHAASANFLAKGSYAQEAH